MSAITVSEALNMREAAESRIAAAISIELERFEDATGLVVSELEIEGLSHGPIGAPRRLVRRVRIHVDFTKRRGS